MVLGLFKKKAKPEVSKHEIGLIHGRFDALSSGLLGSLRDIKESLHQQNRWIDYLHRQSQAIYRGHSAHREISGKEMSEVKGWINRLYSASKKQEKKVGEFESLIKSISSVHMEEVVALGREIALLKKEFGEMDERLKKALKEDIEKEISEHHERARRHVEGRISELHSRLDRKLDDLKEKEARIVEAVQMDSSRALTNPEQKLLNLLVGESDPVSYGQISSRTGHSVNTVRVVMNSLKKRGLIEENMLPSGVKLFNAVNREKIKKIYNIESI